MVSDTNPLDIIKRLDVKQNVTIRVIDEPTGKVVQEHIGHNAATNSLLTGIAHYLMGDGVLNQGQDTLSMWVPQYISLGTMGLTSQESETIVEGDQEYIVPKALGYTPVAPDSATDEEKRLNAELRFSEYINQAPGFGADGYDENSNNDREWFGLGYPYSLKPAALMQDFYDAGQDEYVLSSTSLIKSTVTCNFIGVNSITEYPDTEVGFKPTAIKIQSVTVDGEIITDYHFHNNHIVFNEAPKTGSTISVKYTTVDDNIISVTVYPPTETQPNPVINQDTHDASVKKSVISTEDYAVRINDNNEYVLIIKNGTSYSGRMAVIYTIDSKDATNCELIKASIDRYGSIVSETLRSKISYRNLVSELQSEIPNTLDVVFSAMVSTGALKDYRSDRDYIYITEAGLWSKASYNDSGDNGMLAGYRIMPTDDEVLDIAMQQEFDGDGVTTSFTFEEIATEIVSVTIDGGTIPQYSLDIQNNQIVFVSAPVAGSKITVIYKTDNITNSWKDMSILENRQKVQKSILRIGINQVAQVVWKIQLGGLEQLNGLRYLYPSQYPEEVWELIP